MSDERLTDAQLAAIAAADEKRTPGEWVYEQGREKVCNRTEFATIGVVCDVGSWNQTDADGYFIALASWAIPALVAEVKRLRADVTRLNGCIDAVMRHEGQQEGS